MSDGFERALRCGVFGGRDGIVVSADDGFLDLIGWTRSQFQERQPTLGDLGLPLRSWSPAVSDTMSMLQRAQIHLADGTRRMALVVFDADETTESQWRASAVEVAAPMTAVGELPGPAMNGPEVAWDPRERILVELLRERRRTFAMLDSSKVPMWAVDTELRLVAQNRAFRSTSRYVIGRELQVGEALLGSELGDHLFAQWVPVYRRALDGESFTIRMAPTTAAQVSPAEFVLSPIHDETGMVIGVSVAAHDVTGHERALAALRTGEARFRAAFEHANEVAFLTDDNFRLTFATEAALALLGLERGKLNGTRLWEILELEPGQLTDGHSGAGPRLNPAEDVKTRILESPDRLSLFATPTSNEVDQRILSLTFTNLLDDPAVAGFAVTARDVTDQRRLEQQRSSIESLVDVAARLGRIAVWRADLPDLQLQMSPELMGLLDFDKDAPVPTLIESIDRYPRRYRPMLHTAVSACLTNGTPFDLEMDLMTLNGERMRVRHVVHARRDQTRQIVGVEGATIDITEQRRVEAQLRQQAELLDHASDSIMVQDLDGTIVSINRRAEILFGWKPGEAVGRHAADLVNQGNRAAHDALLDALMRRGNWSGRVTNTTSDGRRIIQELRMTLLRGEDGIPSSVFSIATDVTHRVEMEKRLAQSERLESIGQLTGGIAHDFNNLLTVIVGSSELLSAELHSLPQTETLSELADVADMIHEAADRGSGLTNRLLSFARRQTLRPEALAVDQVLADLDGLIRSAIPASIHLEVSSDSAAWLALADRTQLESSLVNLALNARDAMEGGGSLDISVSNAVFTETQVAALGDVVPGEYVRISIADSGHGMSPEVATRAFEPFFTTKPRGRGTGLGLSMVHGFAKQSGGHVELVSRPVEGTTIDLYLPRATTGDVVTEPDDRHDHRAQVFGRGQGEHVLLVEDEEIVRAHARRLIESLGYRVLEASNGDQALELAASSAVIDVVFTDILMPGGNDGIAVAEGITTLRPGTPVLLTTGYADGMLDEHRTHLPFVTKPYHRSEIADALHWALHPEAADTPLGIRRPEQA